MGQAGKERQQGHEFCMTKPNFFIIGAPKSGTTALASYLGAHPEVFMCDPKEPHHFNKDHSFGKFDDWDEYLELFDGALDSQKIIGEASVWYLFSAVAAENIESALPGSKYLVMLRNPVDMVVALHEQLVFSGFEDLKDFKDAWDAQEDRRKMRRVPRFCTEPKHLLYRDACRTGSQLAHWKSVVPDDRLKVVFFDEFRRDPRKIWFEVQEFLGLKDDRRRDFPRVNSAKERKSFILKFANDAYDAVKEKFGLPSWGTGLMIGLDKWNKRERARPKMSSELRQMLVSEFLSEIELIESLQNVDLSAWKA